MIYKLAVRYLKMNKARSLILLCGITCVMTAMLFVYGLNDSIQYHTKLENEKLYGTYQYGVENANSNQIDEILNHPYVIQISKLYSYATFEYGNIGSIGDISLLPIHLEEGKWPTEENQIAIERHVLIKMGYPEKIGTSIKLNMITNDGERVTKTYIISGIVEDYSMNMLTSSLQIISTFPKKGSQLNLYYTSENQLPLTFFSNEVENSFIQDQFLGLFVNNYLNTNTVIFALFIIGVLMIYSLFNYYHQKIYSRMQLLKSAGATRLQLMGLVWIQACILTVVASCFSLFISIVLLHIYLPTINQQYYYSMSSLLQASIMSILDIFIGSTILGLKAIYSPTWGNGKFNISYRKIKRIRQITPTHLAKRHLKIHYINNIFYMLIASLSLSVMASNIIILNNDDSIKPPTSLFSEGKEITPQYYETFKNIYGIENCKLLKIYENYKRDDMNHYQSTQENGITHIVSIDLLENEELAKLIEDKEAFNLGKSAIIYSPIHHKKQTQDIENINNIDIEVGGEVNVLNHSFKIATTVDQSNITMNINYYNSNLMNNHIVFVSSAFIDSLGLVPDFQLIHFSMSPFGNIATLEKRLTLMNKDTSIVLLGNETKSILTPIIWITFSIMSLVTLVFQRLLVNKYQRLDEYRLYRAIGMCENQWYKMIWVEGLVLNSIPVCIVSIYYMVIHPMYSYLSYKDALKPIYTCMNPTFILVGIILLTAGLLMQLTYTRDIVKNSTKMSYIYKKLH